MLDLPRDQVLEPNDEETHTVQFNNNYKIMGYPIIIGIITTL